MQNAPMQILNQLPRDVADLKFGAFAAGSALSGYSASPMDRWVFEFFIYQTEFWQAPVWVLSFPKPALQPSWFVPVRP